MKTGLMYNRRIDRIIIVLVPLAFGVYASTRPIKRLRADMPPQFVDISPAAGNKQRAAETELARKYWAAAITAVEWRYSYGSPLPDTPPDDFRIDGNTAASAELPSASRLRYWRRLQKVWLSPDSWRTTQEWSLRWLTDPVMRIGDWFDRTVSDFAGKP